MKNKFDPSNRSDKTKRLDEIHAKAIEESRMKSEEEVKKRKEEAQKDLGDVFDALYTVEKANKHVPGPCKNAGDSFKGVPLKVWEKGENGRTGDEERAPLETSHEMDTQLTVLTLIVRLPQVLTESLGRLTGLLLPMRISTPSANGMTGTLNLRRPSRPTRGGETGSRKLSAHKPRRCRS